MLEIKEQKGITLIALIITIIVMIILAGVAISLTLNDNGIFTRAKMARNEYKKAEEKEKNEIEDAYGEIMLATSDDAKITISMKDLNTLIKNKIAEATPDYANGQEITFTNKAYTVEKDGYVQVKFNYTTEGIDVDDKVFINEENLYYNRSDNKWNAFYSPIIQVRKGDIVRYENKAQKVSAKYYPYR